MTGAGLSIAPKINGRRWPLTVSAIELYDRDVRVVRHAHTKKRMPDEGAWWHWWDLDDDTVLTNQSLRHRAVTEFSRKSRQHLAFVAANTATTFDRMITLTYPEIYPLDGKICKKQLGVLLQWLRRRKVNYLWFLEFQKRGAPHFHILIEGGTPIDRDALSHRWYKIVGSGDKRHLAAGTRIERERKKGGLHRYCTKYASKVQQKNVPEAFHNVGRLWGCSSPVTPRPNATIKVDCEESLKSLIRDWDHVSKADMYTVLFDASKHVVATLERVGITAEEVGRVGGRGR